MASISFGTWRMISTLYSPNSKRARAPVCWPWQYTDPLVSLAISRAPATRSVVRTRDLTAEMSTAHSTLNAADPRELKQRGVSTSAIGRFKLVDIARINWANRDLADRFSAAVIALLRRAHPDDLAD